MTADEILHQVWVELHRTAHGTEQRLHILSRDEGRLYDLLTQRLLRSCDEAKSPPSEDQHG